MQHTQAYTHTHAYNQAHTHIHNPLSCLGKTSLWGLFFRNYLKASRIWNLFVKFFGACQLIYNWRHTLIKLSTTTIAINMAAITVT